MDWLQNLLFDENSIAHIVLLYSFVIAVGVLLGKIKFFGVSLGVTFVLFTGIVCGHFGLTGNTQILTFLQDFGLILFVFCIGLQVGPSFFSSFKKGGIAMNLVAMGIVALNIVVAVALYYGLNGRIELPMMVGILCGAVTNTPGLGAANEALSQLNYNGPQIAMGYACAYPLGVLGIIGSIIAIRYICRINLKKEEEDIAKEEAANPHLTPRMMHLEVHNEALAGKTLLQVRDFMGRDFVCSRILQNGHVSIPNRDTVFHLGDQLFVVCAEDDAEAIIAFIGPKIEVDWEKQDTPMVSRRILITQPKMNGKQLGEFHFSSMYGVNVTRVNRSGMDIFASRNLTLQVGDRVMVVGPQDAVERVANLMGNSLKRLDHPNIVTIFVGIFLGIFFGSLPIAFPGIPTPVKAGKVQEAINASNKARHDSVSKRKEILLGTNQYPNFNEKAGEKAPVEAKCCCGGNHDSCEKPFATLNFDRAASQFEALRLQTEKSGKRPKAFMLTIGNLAMRQARAQFSCNFLACAGYEVIDNLGFPTVEAGVEAAMKAGADIVVICSSDDEYAEYAIPAFKALDGRAIFIVAGAPACMEELKAAGIENFIHVRVNVLDTLKEYNAKLGIK
jgi:putative transport protein